MEQFDVLIIGLGPAGVYALKNLKHNHLRILAVDKRKRIQYPVECGEMIPSVQDTRLMFPNITDNLLKQFMEIKDNYVINSTKILEVYEEERFIFKVPFDVWMIDRGRMMQDVVNQTVHKSKNRIKILKNTSVTGIDGNIVFLTDLSTSKSYQIYSKIIVGSDGFNSISAKTAGYACPRGLDRAVCIQSMIKSNRINSDKLQMYIDNSMIPGAYGWIIPKSENCANVGIGYRSKFAGDLTLTEAFKAFLFKRKLVTNKNIDLKDFSTIVAPCPAHKVYPVNVKNNILLAGNSCGQIMSAFGGGISTSIIGGILAAETINDFFQNNSPLEEYDKKWKRIMNKELQFSYQCKTLWDKLFQYPKMIPLFLRFIQPSDFRNIILMKKNWKISLIFYLLGIHRQVSN